MLKEATIWLSINALMACVLVRALAGSFFTKYLAFYVYLGHVLAIACLRFYFYFFKSASYRTIYWYTEFVSVAIGYCVIWEIYRQALASYPGTLRMARRLVLAIFVLVLAKALLNGLTGPVWGAAETVLDLERNLRAVQSVLLVVIVAVLSYYMIPTGGNLRGIMVGYGIFIGVGVINHTIRTHVGDTFQVWWRYSQSVSWLVALLIWTAALWSYHPNPVPNTQVEIERDYEMLSERTAMAVSKARGYILKGLRS